MATQPHTKQSPTRTKEHQELINSTIAFSKKTDIALGALDGFLTAALCILREGGKYVDMDEEDKKDALETLIKSARSALFDANGGHYGVWRVTAGYLYGQQPDAPNPVAATTEWEGI